jgi:hypothetical protein
MKVRVIDIFRDQYTNQVYELNDVLEVDEERFKEIENYVEEIIENKETIKSQNKRAKSSKK